MESLANWSLVYAHKSGLIDEVRLNFYHGISLAGSFFIFAYMASRGLHTRESLLARVLEPGKEGPEVSMEQPLYASWRTFGLCYALAFGMIAWSSLVFSWRLRLGPVEWGDWLVPGCLIGALVLGVLSLRYLERRLWPDAALLHALEDHEAPPGFWALPRSPGGRAVALFFGFFGFIIVNGGVMGVATLSLSSVWEQPYVVYGKLVHKRTGSRSSRHWTIQVRQARFLSNKGLSEQLQLPDRQEFRLYSLHRLDKQLKVGSVVALLVSSGEGIYAVKATAPARPRSRSTISPAIPTPLGPRLATLRAPSVKSISALANPFLSRPKNSL